MERKTAELNTESEAYLSALLADLSSGDAVVRGRARRELIRLGRPVVAPLIQLLSSNSGDLRWEAANTLSHLHDPTATQALIERLDDDRRGIRWLAANGLIAIGQPAVLPLLHALLADPNNSCLLQGAHHVFSALHTKGENDTLAPVLKALEGPVPALETQLAAHHAIEKLERVNTGNYA